MPKICIVLTIGIPGAGKTTFTNKLLAVSPFYGDHKIYTITYDDILKNKTDYKLHRQIAFSKAENIIQKILKQQATANYMILIDDNMYFKSMRYEYYKLARNYQISFLIVHFDVLLPVALQRNSDRQNAVPEGVITRMADNFEIPYENWEQHCLTVNANCEFDDDVFSKFFDTFEKCLQEPVVSVVPTDKKEQYLSKLQIIDLTLRKIVHKKIEEDKLRASDFCKKRTEIFRGIKDGQISVTDMDEFELLQFLDTLF